MPPSDDQNRIEDLKKSLYSRNAPDVRTRRKLRFTDTSPEVKTAWEKAPDEPIVPTALNQTYEDHSMSFFTKLLIGSIIFCIIAVGLGAYIFLNGANLISADNIAITISGPVSIPGGEPESFDVGVINKNNVDLQLVDMSVNFPAGSTAADDPGTEMKNYQKLIGDLKAGQAAHETVRVIMFGEENLQKQILVTITYRIRGSTSVFTKTQAYDVLINSSPVNMTVSSFKEVTSGQEFDMKVDLRSNSKETLKSVLLKANYPFGYTFLSSNIQAQNDNATWMIGDIPAGATREITIHGKLSGENGDARAFHFSVGARSASNTRNIGTEYMAVEYDIAVQKSFISLAMAVGNDTGTTDHAGEFGQTEHVTISWFNNLSVSVANAAIKAKLSGTAYDKSSVAPDSGYFDSVNNTIVWNGRTNPELASVGAGENGTVSFTITPIDRGAAPSPIINPFIKIEVGVSGDRTEESDVSQSLNAAVSRTIKVSSSIFLSGRTLRNAGPFVNSGPIPPKAEETSTYTIVWTVDNTANTIGNAQVTATLPPYIKWLNAISPAGEDIAYDKNNGLVTWNVGSVNAYTARSGERKEVAFRISFTPSVSQIGQIPTLVNQATLTATDNYTSAKLESTQDALTTRFSTDPSYKEGSETVVK